MEITNENIRFYVFARMKFNNSAKEIHEQLLVICGESAPSYQTIARWCHDFRGGHRTSFENLSRSGHPANLLPEGGSITANYY